MLYKVGSKQQFSARVKQTRLHFLAVLILVGSAVPATAQLKPGSPPKQDSNAAEQKEAPEFPKFAQVEEAVAKQLGKSADYKQGDILSSSDANTLFRALEDIGWPVADRSEIAKLFLAEGDFLVKQLRTRKGRKFMRHISSLPSGYDRLDRIRSMLRGRLRVREFINTRDGYKMIEYMTTTKYGKNLGKLLSNGKNGKNFNDPTGRIYEEKTFLKRLKQSYDEEVQSRKTQESGESK